MSMKVLYDKDCQESLIKSKNVLIIGYGSQGHAHALNLKDSGVKNVHVALRKSSQYCTKAQNDGFEICNVEEGVQWADVIMCLVPDEKQPDLYQKHMLPHLKKGQVLFFAHGLSVHFKLIALPDFLDVGMVAPKGPGHTVRSEYVKGAGVPCLIAIAQDASGSTKDMALSYTRALGGGRAGILETTFQHECETDLFGEQAVLCGGLIGLMRAGFETLVEAGYPEEMAYFECIHEMKLIVDMIYQGGLSRMLYSISNTAEYGAYETCDLIATKQTRATMKSALEKIRSGDFTRKWMKENQKGGNDFKEKRESWKKHPSEDVGKRLRAMMPWMANKASSS